MCTSIKGWSEELLGAGRKSILWFKGRGRCVSLRFLRVPRPAKPLLEVGRCRVWAQLRITLQMTWCLILCYLDLVSRTRVELNQGEQASSRSWGTQYDTVNPNPSCQGLSLSPAARSSWPEKSGRVTSMTWFKIWRICSKSSSTSTRALNRKRNHKTKIRRRWPYLCVKPTISPKQRLAMAQPAKFATAKSLMRIQATKRNIQASLAGWRLQPPPQQQREEICVSIFQKSMPRVRYRSRRESAIEQRWIGNGRSTMIWSSALWICQ